MAEPVDRSRYPVRKIQLEDEGDDLDVKRMTPAERVAMVWQLTLQSWLFKEGHLDEDEPRLRRMLCELARARADHLVVGAYVVAAHGRPRATGDLDIWVRATPENAPRVMIALRRFGAPLFDLTLDELSTPGIVLQIGQPPCRIDIITKISGLSFDEAWPNRITISVEGMDLSFLGFDDLITNKRAAARAKDLADVESLLERPKL